MRCTVSYLPNLQQKNGHILTRLPYPETDTITTKRLRVTYTKIESFFIMYSQNMREK